LRYALIPYILEQSKKVTRTGFPVLRAMLLNCPNDKVVWHIDDQYFFGDDFLVAPVMQAGNRRDVYLPEGTWVNFFTGSRTTGPCWLLQQEYPLKDMPVWVREGASIPVYAEQVACTDEMDMSKVSKLSINETFKGLDTSLLADLLTD
jgi:alpha-D-xyloside xylohydrolase